MAKKLSKFRFVANNCARKEHDCPVDNELEFDAIPWGRDKYRVYQTISDDPTMPGNGEWFAGCPTCHSHALVKKLT
jgi:hypothetical protein